MASTWQYQICLLPHMASTCTAAMLLCYGSASSILPLLPRLPPSTASMASSLLPLYAAGPHDEKQQQKQQPIHYEPSKGVKHLMDTFPDLQTIPSPYLLPDPLLRQPISEAKLPVIDLSGLEDGSHCRLHTVQAITLACPEWGIFRVVNHGIDERLVAVMMEAVEGFFALPTEAKQVLSSEDVMNPVRYGTGLNAPAAHVGYWRDFLRHNGHPVHHHIHCWPTHPPNYRAVAREYLEAVRGLAMRLAGAISEGLGLERDNLEGPLREGCQIMAANYYPRCPEPEKTMGMAAHSDHGGLTVLAENGVGGLQVRRGGAWVAVPHSPGSLVVNIGDYLEVFSNGKYKSVEHRAVVNEHRTRISVAVGHGPGLDTILRPQAQLVTPGSRGPRYRPILYRDYVRSQQSSVTRGKSALEGLLVDGLDEPSGGA